VAEKKKRVSISGFIYITAGFIAANTRIIKVRRFISKASFVSLR